MLDKQTWRWAAASRTGTSHLRTGTRKQDAYRIVQFPQGALCAVVSDGAGSASHGGQGASLACRHLVACMKAWLLEHEQLPDLGEVRCWIDDLRDRLTAIAKRRELRLRDFASTLVMLTIHGDQGLALQIGDSALVARKEGVWEAVCWPENGEFASTTYFITDQPEVRLHAFPFDLEHDAFSLFSDGLDSVALEQASQKPFSRFFDPMIKPVDEAEGQGKLANLSQVLGNYLDSENLCERTDDDKTLILISGR
ncbi:PP2C family serine/threonine-protein phosphatase [Oleiagrimonas sp. MCCC 1A03011]|uniref:PP2C family serine/threonine-protein phosphatase n=1 Tax=Oleiagrimonas sp. MCCC 1A03011 TaxID=1926883 RepID=UPI000DDBF739|nr:PP2C family serine/threonine-protein phosphatase [Oleiagrimonas sp. MCCC 1A03011]